MSLFYSFPPAYEALMKMLYGKGFEDRYRAVEALISDGSSVLDVCAGDCYLYRHFLKRRSVRYTAVDASGQFGLFARRHGIDFLPRRVDPAVELPGADYVLLLGSLYQFIPEEKALLENLLRAARKAAIVAEPVRNLSDSPNPLLAAAGKILTYPHTRRLKEKDMRRLFHELGFEEPVLIANGREILAVRLINSR